MKNSSLEDVIAIREISEILHFTTSNGLLGIINTGKLLSHSALPDDDQLSHILQINCKDRSRDIPWHGYVNLSITRINGTFFSISNKWHVKDDIFWCILSFSPEIILHPGVVFSTTNNAYDYSERAPGLEGFENLFSQTVRLFQNKWATRTKNSLASHTTCNQAEVLYPKFVPLEYLQKIYLGSHEHLHEVEAQIGVCAPQLLGKFQLIVAPELFS